jgi:23S rRNA pseudouridine2604 synthase
MRINKYISESGICSRREADKMIESDRVKINGTLAEMGSKVQEHDEVTVDGKIVKRKSSNIYIALYKPVGITCTTDRNIRGNIVDFVNHPERIFHIGRLDKDSDGLILLTNDGDIVNQILRSENNHEKEYIVTLDKPLTKEFLEKMSDGVPLDNVITKKCKISKVSKDTFNIVLTEGRNRQIRRMCSYFDYTVVRLKRIRIMNITLGNLKIGEWRNLTEEELDALLKML